MRNFSLNQAKLYQKKASISKELCQVAETDLRPSVDLNVLCSLMASLFKDSLCRPGVFLTTRADGYLDIWDFFDKQSEPALSFHVSDSSLASLRLQVSRRASDKNVGMIFTIFNSYSSQLVESFPYRLLALHECCCELYLTCCISLNCRLPVSCESDL